MTYQLAHVFAIYRGSDGDATRRLYDRLQRLGPAGEVAVNVFRAQKTSERAKQYRGRGYKQESYGRKQWSIDNLAKVLSEHGAALGIGWGWGLDMARTPHHHVMYVDLPTGQVSWHCPDRSIGPDYAGEWDGIRGSAPERICRWVAALLKEEVAA